MSAAHPILDNNENWTGGYYEAAMVLGPNKAENADARLRAAIIALWSSPVLTPLAFQVNPVRSLQAADIEHCTLDDLCRIYGSMKHPVLGVMPFTSVVVREEYENCEDWLSACVPLGGLSSKDSRVGGWPFGNLDHAEQWRAPLESSLADLALAVAAKVPFRIAAIGFEIAGIIKTNPLSRRVGYVVADGGYRYIPTTQWS